MPDHVHMMLSIPPKYSVAQVVGYIKGKSAINIARTFMERKRNFVGQHFWARGYFVSTAGRDEETPPRKPRLPWAALLLRAFAIDVLACPCGGQRHVLAFVTEVRVVRQLLDHLQLPSKARPWASAQAPPQLELGA